MSTDREEGIRDALAVLQKRLRIAESHAQLVSVRDVIQGCCNAVHKLLDASPEAPSAPPVPRRKVQLYQDRHGSDHTAKFTDEKGKWEASRIGAIHALGQLVISHPEEFNVELTQTDDWSKR
jgi:hypothetical protein